MPRRPRSTPAPTPSATSTSRAPEPPPVKLVPGSKEEAEYWLDLILGGKDRFMQVVAIQMLLSDVRRKARNTAHRILEDARHRIDDEITT